MLAEFREGLPPYLPYLPHLPHLPYLPYLPHSPHLPYLQYLPHLPHFALKDAMLRRAWTTGGVGRVAPNRFTLVRIEAVSTHLLQPSLTFSNLLGIRGTGPSGLQAS